MKRPPFRPDRIYVPLLLNGLLGLAWFFVIYNRSGADLPGRAGEPLFLIFALALPFAVTLCASLFLADRQQVGLVAGLSLVFFSYLGTWLHTTNRINLLEAPFPNYFRDFEQAGSYDLVFFFFGLLFILVGTGLGRLCRIVDAADEAEGRVFLSKNQRRSKKKRKKAMQARKGDVERFVEQILEDEETSDDGDEEETPPAPQDR